jgi:hypothetical protein
MTKIGTNYEEQVTGLQETFNLLKPSGNFTYRQV